MKVAILGAGVTGLALLKYFYHFTQAQIILINRGDPQQWAETLRDTYQDEDRIQFLDEKNCDDQLLTANCFYISPGIAPNHPLLIMASQHKLKISSEIELAYSLASHIPVVAITGTNGKTTTATMMAQALNLAHKKAFLGGNIGTPYLEMVMSGEQYDLAVIELSSFQLELLETFAPHVAILLNISENHGERYQHMQDYLAAKLQIFKMQTQNDFAILHQDIQFTPQAQLISFGGSDQHLNELDFTHAKVFGKHNQLNFHVVYKTLLVLKINSAKEIMQKLIANFTGVHYRLENVHHWQSLIFFNDAKSTNWTATMSALTSLQGDFEQQILILGGQKRKVQEDVPSEYLEQLKNIFKIYLIGQTRFDLQVSFSDYENVSSLENLAMALEDIGELKITKKTAVIFSPAYPSFDQYANYLERGNAFNELVKKLF